MKFEYRYFGQSVVSNTTTTTQLQFAPNVLRKPTYFNAELAAHLPFREAMSALHDVVVSDLRFKPKDRTEYFKWLKTQEPVFLAEFMAEQANIGEKISVVKNELSDIRAKKNALLKPFYSAQKKYFDYLYNNYRDAWFVLDPVITVHPDQVFFECFSGDESTYARLSCSHNIFKRIGDFACGTTNIDYSAGLYNEFQKIRDYKTTSLTIDPSGFQVQHNNEAEYKEQKIDLPDSWVRGFLQVSSAMTLPTQVLQLHPMDIYNICLVLRRYKEQSSPRSLKFILNPGQPIKLVFEPWNHEVICHRSVFTGHQATEVRVWGRRRLLTLERLIPVANYFTVHLLGTGLPSFWIAHLPDMEYTLGLSGWTNNDWSRAGQFDLLAPRDFVDESDLQKVLDVLSQHWFMTQDNLVKQTNLSAPTVVAALTLLTQGGRVIYDLVNKVWRLRELNPTPLPLSELRFANEREKNAAEFLANNLVNIKNKKVGEDNALQEIRASVLMLKNKKHSFEVKLEFDADQRLINGQCNCQYFYQNQLRQGPCEHMLAVRLAHSAQQVMVSV